MVIKEIINYIRKVYQLKIFYIFTMFFCSFAYGEEFTMICEGERTVRSFSSNELNDLDFETVLLKIKKNQWNI